MRVQEWRRASLGRQCEHRETPMGIGQERGVVRHPVRGDEIPAADPAPVERRVQSRDDVTYEARATHNDAGLNDETLDGGRQTDAAAKPYLAALGSEPRAGVPLPMRVGGVGVLDDDFDERALIRL